MAAGDTGSKRYWYLNSPGTVAYLSLPAALSPLGMSLTVDIVADAVYEFRGHIPLAYHDVAGAWVRQSINIDSGTRLIYVRYEIVPGTVVYFPLTWQLVLPANLLTAGSHTFAWYSESSGASFHPYDGALGNGNYGPMTMSCTRTQ